MFKYIYVFILIVILFGIKWKLQKKYEFKEEFYLTSDAKALAAAARVAWEATDETYATRNKLTDMFSSSDDFTFYDKLYRINSNIKFDSNLSWNLDTSTTIWFEHEGTNSNNRIELRHDAQGIGFGDNINGIHDKVLTSVHNDKLSFVLQQLYSTDTVWTSNFASFDINSNNTSNINESVSNLKSWHIPVISYMGYSGEPFAAAFSESNVIGMWNNLTLSECHTLCATDGNCVGFEMDDTPDRVLGSSFVGTCSKYKTYITLDRTRSDRTTFIKPPNTFT